MRDRPLPSKLLDHSVSHRSFEVFTIHDLHNAVEGSFAPRVTPLFIGDSGRGVVHGLPTAYRAYTTRNKFAPFCAAPTFNAQNSEVRYLLNTPPS
jgi:hypothetical protein